MVTIWSNRAKKQLRAVFEYIKQDSPQNAEKVRDELIDATIKLASHPETYPIDKYKINNDGSYRAFELHHYRVSYRILKTEIRVVRLRHTSRSPKGY
jgi:plasmid stabilization system protein ParE